MLNIVPKISFNFTVKYKITNAWFLSIYNSFSLLNMENNNWIGDGVDYISEKFVSLFFISCLYQIGNHVEY